MEDTKVVLDVINKAPEIKTVFKYWYDDNAFKSSFLHALSSVFYGGESYGRIRKLWTIINRSKR